MKLHCTVLGYITNEITWPQTPHAQLVPTRQTSDNTAQQQH